MTDDILDRLRWNGQLADIRIYSELLTEAADEIERLRSLIVEWANAEEALNDYTSVEDVDPVVAVAYNDAWLAIRSAVGR
jgi:hypothetical protein